VATLLLNLVYGLYSFISVTAVFLSGRLAANPHGIAFPEAVLGGTDISPIKIRSREEISGLSVAGNSPVGGLIERFTIGGFLQLLFVIALMMYSSEVTSASRSSKQAFVFRAGAQPRHAADWLCLAVPGGPRLIWALRHFIEDDKPGVRRNICIPHKF